MTRSRGFSLIEILVVLVIMGMLVAVVAPRLQGIYERLQVRIELDRLQQQLQGLSLRAFGEERAYAVTAQGRQLTVRAGDGDTWTIETEYLFFPPATINYNRNGFTRQSDITVHVGDEVVRLPLPLALQPDPKT